MCLSASVSLKARPRSSAVFCRIDAGSVSAISAERLAAPTVFSIAATSPGAGPIWRRTKVVAGSVSGLRGAVIGCPFAFPWRSRDVLLIGGLIHQAVEFAFVCNFQLEEPGFTGRVGIDQRGLGDKLIVDFHHLAGNRRVDVGGGLDRFDDGDRFGLLQGAA